MTDGDKLPEGVLWEEYYTNLHQAHRLLRATFLKSGLTQDQLAAKLGVSKSLISKRLNGEANLTLKTLSFMASALNCRLQIEPIPYDEVQGPDLRGKTKSPMTTTTESREFVTTGDIAGPSRVPRAPSWRGKT
jgi:transcriptional regulator with XRE-family HTH domain